MREILILLFLIFCHPGFSKIVRDTIFTTDMDRIIVNYEIKRIDNSYVVRFSNDVRRELGTINREKYDDLSKVAVLFFDRTGNYRNDVSISGLVPQSIMIPSNIRYNQSSDGFFVIQDNPSLTFETSGEAIVSIPIYLAFHPKRGKYILFSKCNGLKLVLSSSNSVISNRLMSQMTRQVVTSTAEIEVDNTMLIKIMESVNLAKRLIAESDRLPFSESLVDEINYLRQKKREITDSSALLEIADVLDSYETKKADLENKASEAQLIAQQQAEYKAKSEAEALQAKNDSIAAAQQLEVQRAQKRNLLLIVGGIILAVLGFIGNQVLQHFRNVRNQKNMMNMQQSLVDQAEKEAKRQARNAARGASVRLKNNVKTKVSTTMNKKDYLRINGKNKNLSI